MLTSSLSEEQISSISGMISSTAAAEASGDRSLFMVNLEQVLRFAMDNVPSQYRSRFRTHVDLASLLRAVMDFVAGGKNKGASPTVLCADDAALLNIGFSAFYVLDEKEVSVYYQMGVHATAGFTSEYPHLTPILSAPGGRGILAALMSKGVDVLDPSADLSIE